MFVGAGKVRELASWAGFKVFEAVYVDTPSEATVGAQWVPTRKVAEGKEDVNARVVAKEYQGPGWGLTWRAHAPGALKKWEISSRRTLQNEEQRNIRGPKARITSKRRRPALPKKYSA